MKQLKKSSRRKTAMSKHKNEGVRVDVSAKKRKGGKKSYVRKSNRSWLKSNFDLLVLVAKLIFNNFTLICEYLSSVIEALKGIF
ncbi:putative uncharacterized protein [Pseudomonas sp. StFLB209]|uniref:hypothetical protein n=1 Tax=Pseudomonas sp. StFLB209 TaxID=1028989 RepID=UPI0004F74019|nr:hypothetical protein [Pseudomonas sp. StFLB209]BAP44743.1 putative uncharacterized protein [Pseudomonas sp. StFLB209]